MTHEYKEVTESFMGGGVQRGLHFGKCGPEIVLVDHGHRRAHHPRQYRVSFHRQRRRILPAYKLSPRRPIVQSGFHSFPPAYPLLHIDALNSVLATSPRPTDVDPVIYVPAIDVGKPSACCHVKRGELRYLCPVSGDRECPLLYLS